MLAILWLVLVSNLCLYLFCFYFFFTIWWKLASLEVRIRELEEGK